MKIIDATLKLIDDAISLGKLKNDHRVHAILETDTVTDPGEAFMRIVRQWPSYSKN